MLPHTAPASLAQHLLIALAAFDYLTAQQAARVLGKERSLTYIRDTLRSLVAKKLVLAVEGYAVTMPRVYTLTKKGREYVTMMLGTPTDKRFRPSEEQDKGHNPYFMQHTLAVSDVLIAAQLLSQTIPGITLTRMFTERALRRKIAVTLPTRTGDGTAHHRSMYVEPDASCDFLLHQTWQTFVHIEVYRNLPPVEWRFKRKIVGYVTYAVSGQHEELFQTPSLSIAVITPTAQMAATLKRWTEEALHASTQPDYGELFFFSSLNTASASPEDIFLSPIWEQAFNTAKTPLLVLEEETK
jgi:hypothetical protein